MTLQNNQPTTGTILVADDQVPNRELLEELLSTEGFKVVTAADGAEALHQASRVPIDLLLLDVIMPGLSGFEVCTKVKSNPETCFMDLAWVALFCFGNICRGLPRRGATQRVGDRKLYNLLSNAVPPFWSYFNS